MNISIEKINKRHAKDTWKYRGDKSLWTYMECDTPLPSTIYSEAQAFDEMSKMENCIVMAIIVDEECVGVTKLKNIANGAAELSYYVLRKELWGKGVASEATRQLIDIGFDSGLDLIYRYVNILNVPSYVMTSRQKFVAVGKSFVNSNVLRFEMTKTGWNRQRNALKRAN